MGLFDGFFDRAQFGGVNAPPGWLTSILSGPQIAPSQGFASQGDVAIPPNAQPAMGMLSGLPSIPSDRDREGMAGYSPYSQPSVGGAPIPQMQFPQIMPQAASQMAQQPSGPGFGDRLSAGMEALGGIGTQTGLIGGLAGALQGLATGSSPNNRTIEWLTKQRGLDPYTAEMLAKNPDMMKAYAMQTLTKAARPLSSQEKQAYGLKADMPWFLGADGKPTLPEGFAQTKREITKDANGNPIAVDPYSGSGAPVAGLPASSPNFENVSATRKEISGLPEVKRISEALPIFRSMVQSHDKDSAAADLDYVYGVAKIFDPDSVVREGEMKLVGTAQSLPEDIKGFIKRVAFGEGRLDAAARQRILEVAHTRMTELKGSVDQRLTPYKGIAQRNNIKPEDIMPQFQEFPQLPPPPPPAAAVPGAAPQQPPTATDAAGRKIMLKDGKWVPFK